MEIISYFKPAASCRAHLFTGAIVWTLIGLFLTFRGVWNMLNLPGFSTWWVIAALFIGILKGQLVFIKSAQRSVQRITCRGDGKCLGGFLSVRNWILVISMICLGRLLRLSSLHGAIVWGVYVAAGTALTVSSRVFWAAWRRQKGEVRQ